MKLQGKKAIQNQANIQKKQQIDEGIKIATRVDDLRRTLAQEEQNLSFFRDRSIEALRKDIEPLVKERDSLKIEIKDLLEQKKILIDLPVEATNREIAERKAKIALIEEEMTEKNRILSQKEDQIAEKWREVTAANDKVKALKAEITSIHEQMLKDGKKTAEILEEAEQKLTQIREYCDGEKKKLDEYERKLELREVDLDNRERHVGEKEKDVANREIVLKDRYAVLQETITRLNIKV